MIILKYTLKKSASICKYIVNKIAYICFIFGAGVMIYSEYFVRDRQFDKQIDITELFELISYAVISYILLFIGHIGISARVKKKKIWSCFLLVELLISAAVVLYYSYNGFLDPYSDNCVGSRGWILSLDQNNCICLIVISTISLYITLHKKRTRHPQPPLTND